MRGILAGRDTRFLTDRDGAALKGLQHLVERILAREERFDLVPLVEVEGQQAEMDTALKGRALEAAEEVRRTGEPVKLPPMNPFERRIVHLALRGEEDLTTFSTGEGSTRAITVALASSQDAEPTPEPGAADPD
jgi:spoIIIJ-associated protein